ncbi:MAG: HTH-type transcriptional activator TipA [Firmicutes bacterium ADurb.Bin419]|nr:MAG: HTH-type transcriptional activator TipA [Firmicutes bacterium ADurb.Bin419]
MYTRGQFALIGKTTIKALHIYDEMGLLVPERIDAGNQYKYYSTQQIDEIVFINELKTFGFSLEEIKRIKQKNEPAYLKEKLEKRLHQLENEVKEAGRSRKEILKKIQIINSEVSSFDSESEYLIELVQLDEMIVAGFRDKISLQDVGSLIGSVYESIHQLSLEPLDSHMLIFHSDEMDTQTNNLDIEVCVSVNKHVKTDCFQTKAIEGMTCAKTTHIGGFSEAGRAHAAVIDWIKDNGYEIIGSPIEKYLASGPMIFNPASLRIDVLYPVKLLKGGC